MSLEGKTDRQAWLSEPLIAAANDRNGNFRDVHARPVFADADTMVVVSVPGDSPEALTTWTQTGEVLVQGENIIDRYWNDPEESAKAIDDGSMRTGDIGYVDDNGWL